MNQAANLADQCLKDLAELKQLESSDFNLNQEIALAEKIIEIEESKPEFFERDLIVNENYHEGLHARYLYDNQASNLALAITNTGLGQNPKDSILLYERYVIDTVQKFERQLSEKRRNWFRADSQKNRQLFDFKTEQLATRKTQREKTMALDFAYQKELCLTRLESNYRDSLNRAFIAEDGLEIIYGREPTLGDRLLESEDLQFRVNELRNWIYKSIESVMAYSQLDQSFTTCVSLRYALSEDGFATLNSSNEDFNTAFEISRDLFPLGTHQNIRLKGIGAFFVGKVGDIPWRIEIGVPTNAVYLRDADEFTVDQTNVPSCILGRVESRNSVRGVEFGGMVSLNNVSPIAAEGNSLSQSWRIKIDRPHSTTEMFNNIEDIILELNLTGKVGIA